MTCGFLFSFNTVPSCESFHLPGERGTEHDHLLVRPTVVDDPHDLRLESHVEHPVSLVQDDVGNSAGVGHAAGVGRQHVNHPTRCADNDLGTPLQLRDLLRDPGPAVDTDAPDPLQRPLELPDLFPDLHAQFPRWSHDDRDRAVVFLKLGLGHYVSEEGEEESQGFARASLRDTDHVPAGHNDGNGLCLWKFMKIEIRIRRAEFFYE